MTAGDGFDVRSLALTMRPGAQLGAHRHAWAQLVFATSGVMRVSTDTETWLTPATKAIWIPAGLVAGHFAYFAVPTNSRAISAFRHHVIDLWRRTLRRRSQRDRSTWARIDRISQDWLPRPRILHPWHEARFAVTHPR